MQYGETDSTFAIDRRYLDWLTQGDCLPLLIAPFADTQALTEALDACDGLLIPGGNDIDPGLYGAEPLPGGDTPVPLRDHAELFAVREAYRRNLPFLGVCRGLQMMNVALGGTLVQDLPEGPASIRHRNEEPVTGAHHTVEPVRGGLLALITGDAPYGVASLHHQAVDRLAAPLTVEAYAPDGVIEAASAPDRSFFLGVQWHPETLAESAPSVALAQAFAEACRR